ncbi:MAG TPA: DMT family transporter [Gammaproteobacteria bacterium]|nr:DMT family transporter [Gammaproteobacteria bacterium]
MQLSAGDNPRLAIGAILLACLALSLGDALIKQSSARFVIWQIFVLRSLLVIPFLIYFVRIHRRGTTLMPRHVGWTLLRNLILVLMWIFYFAALPQIELATAAAAYYTLPLFIVLFAALFLGESITGGGWIALALGFTGALLILQPQADDFDGYALLPIAAAVCYAAAMILTRGKCRNERSTVLSLWLNLTFVGVGVIALGALQLWQLSADSVALNPFLFGAWTPMSPDGWRVMAILAVAILIGSVGAAIAYQNGPSSVVAIFDFSYLGFAVVWGSLLFGELPGPVVAGGMLLITVAGIIAIRQGSAQKRTQRGSG